MVQEKINFPLTSQQLADLIVTAFEGGSNYWIESVSYEGTAKETPWYSDPSFYENDWVIFITPDDDDEYELNKDLISRNRTPKRVADDLRNDMMDAETADVWLQNALFNEIVFG